MPPLESIEVAGRNGTPPRPGKLTPWVRARICDLLAQGYGLAKTCRYLKISRQTVYNYARDDLAFSRAIDEARRMGAEALAEEALEIADTEPDANRARVRVESRKWLASVTDPQRYGPKTQIQVAHNIDLAGALAEARARVSGNRIIEIDAAAVDAGLLDHVKPAAASELADEGELAGLLE